MSHWSKGTVKVKDLSILDMIAERSGLKVHKGEKRGDKVKLHSSYAGQMEVDRMYWYNGAEMGVVQNAAGSYDVVLDNYRNPICSIVGRDGDKLLQDYGVEVVHQQAMNMGGIISNQETLADGSVAIEIQI